MMYIEYCDMRKVCWEAFVHEKKKLTLLKTNEHDSPKKWRWMEDDFRFRSRDFYVEAPFVFVGDCTRFWMVLGENKNRCANAMPSPVLLGNSVFDS